jgi:hypothetical protein
MMLYKVFQVLQPPRNVISVKEMSVPISLARYIDRIKYSIPLEKKDKDFALTPLKKMNKRAAKPIPKEIITDIFIASNHPNQPKILITIYISRKRSWVKAKNAKNRFI